MPSRDPSTPGRLARYFAPDSSALIRLVAAPPVAASTVTAPPAPVSPATQVSAPLSAPAPASPPADWPSEQQIAQKVLQDVQRQIDGMLDFRLREAMAPVLARHADSLDFHDTAVWCIRDALEAAFKAGVELGASSPKATEAELAKD